MLRLSIIVPVYNVERYIAKCLKSLIDQDLHATEFEIVIVNDGSTDNSETVIKSFLNKNPQIKLIKQCNNGLSSARNTGIKQAKGEYLMFVDSDDFLEPNVLKSLLYKMDNERLDILRYNFQNIFENNTTILKSNIIEFNHNICDGMTFLNNYIGFTCYAWQFILDTKFLKSNSNYFKEGIFFEDTEWTPRILVNAKRVASTNIVVYNYLYREGSITKSISDDRKYKWINDKINLIQGLKLENKKYPSINWYKGMIAHITISVLTYAASNYYTEMNYYVNTLKQLKVFPISNYKSNIRSKIRLFLINLSPVLYCKIIHLKQAR